MISLIPVSRVLNQVPVYSSRETFTIGNKKTSFGHIGWGDIKKSRGRIRGYLVKINECLAVNDFIFRIHHNDWDSVKFRLNILDAENFGQSLLSSNIFITTSKKSGWVTTALDKYNIVLCKDFIVALEWVDAWGKIQTDNNIETNQLTFSLSNHGGENYYRDTPDEKVDLTVTDKTPAMYFDVYRMGTKTLK